MDARSIFAFLHAAMDAGERCALISIISVTGSSMRPPGTHMAVCEDGRYEGSLSGGCIEAAIVAEAVEAIRAGYPRLVRYGAGSPYVDIRLPCGGGVDVHFLPLSDGDAVAKANAAFAERKPFIITIPKGSGPLGFDAQVPKIKIILGESYWHVGHWPVPKLLIIGHGESVAALAALTQAAGLELSVATPDDGLCSNLRDQDIAVWQLRNVNDMDVVDSDAWTAIAFLFHDHDWEEKLLPRALSAPHFYVGAMGGRTAHAARMKLLKSAGVSDAAISTIRAPIGLFHSSRDPGALAVSVLAEVMKKQGEIEAARLEI